MTSPNQRIIGIYGPTDPRIWGPSNEYKNIEIFYNKTHCSPCYKNDGIFTKCIFENENFQICMKTISAESIFAKIIN